MMKRGKENNILSRVMTGAEGGAGVLHQITQLGEEEGEDVRLVTRCEEKRKEFGIALVRLRGARSEGQAVEE